MLSSNILHGTMLVALDGSTASQSAARIALRLARLFKATTCGLFVVDSHFITNAYSKNQAELGDFRTVPSRSGLFMELEKRCEQALSQFEEDCIRLSVPVTTEMEFGIVSRVIQKKVPSCTFLALGRRGWGHSDDPLELGHNFREILRAVKKSILVGGEDHTLIRRILLTYPNSESLQNSINFISLIEGALFGEMGRFAPLWHFVCKIPQSRTSPADLARSN